MAFSVNLPRYLECLLQWQRFCLDVGENWPTFSLRDSFKIWSLKGGKNSHIAKAGAECIDATAIWCERIKLDQGMPKVIYPKYYKQKHKKCNFNHKLTVFLLIY